MSRPRWACLARPRTSGGGVGSPKATPGSRIARVARTGVRIRLRRGSSNAIVRLRQRRKLGPARIASIVGIPASTVHRVLCRHGLNRHRVDGPPDRPGDPPDRHRPARRARAHRRQETRADPTRWRLASPRPRATPCGTADDRGRLRLHPLRDRRAQPPRLSARSSPTRRARPAPSSGTEPEQFFADHAITVEARPDRQRPQLHSAATTFTSRARAGSNIAASGPADPRPTAKSNGSTAPCSTSGPTSAPTPQTADAPVPLTASCTPTTITAATPPSEATHRHPRYQTSPGQHH